MSPSKPFLPTRTDEEPLEPSSASAVKRRAYASLVLVFAATAAMLFFDAAFPLELPSSSSMATMISSPPQPRPRPQPPQPPVPKFPSASCMHFVGGGAARPGGAFPQPRQRSPRCWPSIQAYFERGDYLADVAEAVGDAREALRFYSRPSRDLVLVFDIDETSLSNAEEWMTVGKTTTGNSSNSSIGSSGSSEEEEELLFGLDPLAALERRALAASSPPLQATLGLYRDAYAAGFSVAFVTGRTDRGGMREATKKNLEEAGYGVECSSGSEDDGGKEGSPDAAAAPCYLSLTMRSPGDARPASVYKPEARAKLLLGGGWKNGRNLNLTLVASLGDQFSDLVGAAGAHASFKLPNPVYAIL